MKLKVKNLNLYLLEFTHITRMFSRFLKNVGNRKSMGNLISVKTAHRVVRQDAKFYDLNFKVYQDIDWKLKYTIYFKSMSGLPISE